MNGYCVPIFILTPGQESDENKNGICFLISIFHFSNDNDNDKLLAFE